MSENDDSNWERERQLDRDEEREQASLSRRRPSARRNRQAPPETRDVLCADQVAAWLGVDRKSVYNAAARGKLPVQRLGKRLLFSRNAISVWLSPPAQPAQAVAVP